eukprot:TRINITY_DN10086_c0_g1_i1.p1 TRINITY_DN10086_c0_g1~~TRINITY_DN10086_c0_g1_i1.p1  ORF type:complete len:457 (+),score=54.74 TRINITY_DN10086_c0_g1_i1:43-1413(+)
MESDNEVKLKFDNEINIEDVFMDNLENGMFQTMKIICQDGSMIQLNPMFIYLLFPWLGDSITPLHHDLILLPDYQRDGVYRNIQTILRSYKSSQGLKCEVKIEEETVVESENLQTEIIQDNADFERRNIRNNAINKNESIENEEVEEDRFSENSNHSFPNTETSMNQNENNACQNLTQDLDQYFSDNSKNSSKCNICLIETKNCDKREHLKLQHNELFQNYYTRKKKSGKPSTKIRENIYDKVAIEKLPRKHKSRLCTVCGKSVKNLSKHSLIHKGIKPERLQCHLCEKTLCSANALKVHIESVHEGIKRYPCSMCPTSFVYEAYLKQHIQVVHENYRPPEATCPDCGKQFKFISNMTRHRRITHQGENIQRRHFCQICKAMFMKVSLLHKHIREEHGLNPRKRGEMKRAMTDETGPDIPAGLSTSGGSGGGKQEDLGASSQNDTSSNVNQYGNFI